MKIYVQYCAIHIGQGTITKTCICLNNGRN
jgi:hypothetical protein